MADGWTWEQMLDEFRALGGVADNVCRRRGRKGWGLYPIDPQLPVRIYAPDNLLVANDLVISDGDTLRIKRGAAIGEREAAFVERYQAEFSWGAGGRAECAAFFAGMDAFPGPLRRVLTAEFGFGKLFSQNTPECILKRFLQTRRINYHGEQTMMPLVELINHGFAGALYERYNGVAVSGRFADEILAQYHRRRSDHRLRQLRVRRCAAARLQSVGVAGRERARFGCSTLIQRRGRRRAAARIERRGHRDFALAARERRGSAGAVA